MASVGNPPGGSPTVLMTPVAGAQVAGEVRQALERAGWRVIVAPDPNSYVTTAAACVIVFSPETASDPAVSAAIGAGFTTLIPVTTTPMPVPFAQWSMPPVPLGTDVDQQQRAAATILQKLAQVRPGVPAAPIAPAAPAMAAAPPAPVVAPPVAPPMAPPIPQAAPVMPLAAPYYPQPAAPPTPMYAAPSTPMYAPPPPSAPVYTPPAAQGYAPPSTPMYAPPATPGYPPQPGYPQPYGQLAGYPTRAPKSGFPGWLRNTIIIGVIAALLIGGYTVASNQHLFNPNALSGQWTMKQTFNSSSGLGDTAPGTLTLTESGTQLSGELSFSSSGSSGSSIPLTGTFSGQSVSLNGSLTDNSSGSPQTLTITLNGAASSDDQTIQGDGRYALTGSGSGDGVLSGPWIATRATSASKGSSTMRPVSVHALVAALRHD